MSGPPPPYEEPVPAALIVNLQIWHYRSEERSPENNERLASLFRNNAQEWEVIPSEDDRVTGTSSHDQFVPIEVRFRHQTWAYNDPGENPMADVRKLFFKTLRNSSTSTLSRS
ncbi:hypothetical protein BKA65DRAFT_478837 [Rhexocercosporidium sp. MPI-PUGE-AT-0058]|nr:hypothetical protein BKA65DRAFT_478837 [Rhexocercosporidium sp. MPI-PUGE-AT-0058]